MFTDLPTDERISAMPAPKRVAPRPQTKDKTAVRLPPIHVEFRMNIPGGKYFTAMADHKVMAVDFHLGPEHIEFLNSEQVRVEFGRQGIVIDASGSGSVCHRLDSGIIRASVIFDSFDETLLYYLFALTNGKPIFIDGITKYLSEFDVTMKAAPTLAGPATDETKRSITLLTESTTVHHKAVPTTAENSRRVAKRREQLRTTSFSDRLAQAEKLIGELSLIMETFDDIPGIDTQLVVAKDGLSVKARLRRD